MNFCTQVFELCIAVYVMQLSIGILLDVFFHKSFFNTSFTEDVKPVGR